MKKKNWLHIVDRVTHFWNTLPYLHNDTIDKTRKIYFWISLFPNKYWWHLTKRWICKSQTHIKMTFLFLKHILASRIRINSGSMIIEIEMHRFRFCIQSPIFLHSFKIKSLVGQSNKTRRRSERQQDEWWPLLVLCCC